MSKRILDAIDIGNGGVRSISLERDLYEPRSLDQYMVTPTAVAALEQLGRALRDESPQRAWKIVGPYGSGKSALGVAIGQLFAGEAHFPGIAEKLRKESKRTYELFQKSRRYPISLAGSRISLGVALARALRNVVDSWSESAAGTAFRKRLDEQSGTYSGIPLNAAVAKMAADFADAAGEAGFAGVVLLIDELGKFVEHAALRPEEGDLMALQQLAERASGHGDDRISVVAFLHQHLTSYADNVGKSLTDDWEKVASRFEEIPFDEPVERYAHFAANVLNVRELVTENSHIHKAANSLFRGALEMGLLRSQSESDADLFAEPQRLYPLHPAVIAALAIAAKRLGQSERSFHAFLRGDEPFALRHYAEANAVDAANWYRLDTLYDHFASGYGLRFRERNAERRWTFAATCVEREDPKKVTSSVLKVIAVLELVQSGLRIPITATLARHALDHLDPSTVDEALDDLVSRGVLLARRDDREYSIAVAEVANIDALMDEAAREDEGKLLVRALSSAIASRPVVAHRHYDKTGTLRTMGVLVGTVESWPTSPKTSNDEVSPDGWLKLLLATSNGREVKACQERFKREDDPLVLHACFVLDPESRATFVEYATWLSVHERLLVSHLDPWASQYVERQLVAIRERVDRVLAAQFAQTAKRHKVQYWYRRAAVDGASEMNLSQLASWLFDKEFPLTPRVVNELVNKDRPASAIVLARQRMFDVLMGGDHTKAICGEAEYPPERLIHQTLLRDTGIWREASGRWFLEAPTDNASVQLQPIWNAIGEELQTGTGVTVSALLEKLSAPPYGVRAAPAGIWIATYLLVRRSSCAVFERGSLVLELTAEHLQRLYKNPGVFELRELPATDDNQQLLNDYRSALATVGCSVDGPLTQFEVTRALYRWLARLPQFAQETGRLGKDASLLRTQLQRSRDQIDLLTRAIPRAHRDSKSQVCFKEWLAAVLGEIGSVYRRLQEEVSSVLSSSFEIAGTLSRVRSQLQKECRDAAADLAEAHLKAFVLRCADPTLSDERWLDSVASLVVQRTLDVWTDSTLGQFESALIELCAQYKRWVRVVNHRVRNPAIGERFVSLTMTLPNGSESAVFVVADDRTKAMANDLLARLGELTSVNRELMISTLGQALLQCQIEAQQTGAQEEQHGRQQAS